MHRTRRCVSEAKNFSPTPTAARPLLSALSSPSALRPAYQEVVKRAMSQYKYADVSLSDIKNIETRTLILAHRLASTSQIPHSAGSTTANSITMMTQSMS